MQAIKHNYRAINACIFCDSDRLESLLNLGYTPIANNLPDIATYNKVEEARYPLHLLACQKCGLVQLSIHIDKTRLFGDYTYFSSYSATMLSHAENYATRIIQRLSLNKNSRVIEIASNDGYLLQYFKHAGIADVQGIDPSYTVAEAAAKNHDIPTICDYFGTDLARRIADKKADLVIANNVLAHVPDLKDFIAGLTYILKPEGVVTIEFPDFVNLVAHNEFDTIYHEHFYYFTLPAIIKILEHFGLKVFDYEEIPVHGGSIRIYATLNPEAKIVTAANSPIDIYSLTANADMVRTKLLKLLTDIKRKGQSIGAYGAPAKACTLLNYCGIDSSIIDFTVDKNPIKQGKVIAGTGIPVFAPEEISIANPDYILILPWNIKDEIIKQLSDYRGKFILPVPEPEILA